MEVGLLPKESVQQVDFAFDTYMTTGNEGYKLSRGFKKSFAYASFSSSPLYL